MVNVDKVAEAIWRADMSSSAFYGHSWDSDIVPTDTEKDTYRHLAQAAIEAMGLTAETREIPVPNGNPCTCNRPDGKHYGMMCDLNRTDWIPHTRLVSPWRAGDDN